MYHAAQNNLQNKQIKIKRIALMLCVCFVVVFLFAQIYIITHVNHDCIGDGCPICELLRSMRTLLNHIGTAVVIVFVMFTGLFAGIILAMKYIFDDIASVNLVDLKVRINK